MSQDSLSFKNVENRNIKSIIKFSPLHLINFYPSIQVAYEHRLTPATSLQIDLGYVFYNFSTPEFIRKNGFKAKAEYRYYLKDERTDRKSPYLSAEPYINAVNFHREENTIQCFDLDCQLQFSQKIRYLVQYRETGFSLKYGQVFTMWNNFIFDLNYGMTIRIIRYKEKGRDSSPPQDFFDGFLSIPNERNRIGISPALGLRVGYIIKP